MIDLGQRAAQQRAVRIAQPVFEEHLEHRAESEDRAAKLVGRPRRAHMQPLGALFGVDRRGQQPNNVGKQYPDDLERGLGSLRRITCKEQRPPSVDRHHAARTDDLSEAPLHFRAPKLRESAPPFDGRERVAELTPLPGAEPSDVGEVHRTVVGPAPAADRSAV